MPRLRREAGAHGPFTAIPRGYGRRTGGGSNRVAGAAALALELLRTEPRRTDVAVAGRYGVVLLSLGRVAHAGGIGPQRVRFGAWSSRLAMGWRRRLARDTAAGLDAAH